MPAFKLTLDNYFSPDRPHISRTMITDYLSSPEFYKKKYIDRVIPRKITPSMQLGSLVDSVLTRGVNPYRCRVLKRDDPEEYAAQQTMDEDYLVTETVWDQAMTVIAEVKRQPYWKKGLDQAHFQVVLEGKVEGVLTCGLPDRIDPLGDETYRLIDLKVVNPMKIDSPMRWLWNAWDMGYIHQAALYQRLFADKQGIPNKNITCAHVVAAPVDTGYAESRIYYIPQPLIDKAMAEVLKALRGIKARDFKPRLLSWDDAVTLPDLNQIQD